MGENSKIAWCNHTYNPWRGCHKVSAGCTHCYMFRDQTRYGMDPNVVVRSKPKTFNLPLRLNKALEGSGKREIVFVCSWSDYFIEEADSWRQDVWNIIAKTPNLFYLLLTKRAERIKECLPLNWGDGWENVGLGITAENQEMCDERMPILSSLPSKMKWISVEPMLGPVVLPENSGLDWSIYGCESGNPRRVMNLDWVRAGIIDCGIKGISPFVKQIEINGETTSELVDFPVDLRVREFPTKIYLPQ